MPSPVCLVPAWFATGLTPHVDEISLPDGGRTLTAQAAGGLLCGAIAASVSLLIVSRRGKHRRTSSSASAKDAPVRGAVVTRTTQTATTTTTAPRRARRGGASGSAAAPAAARLPPEPQCGCIEYKRKFGCAVGDARFGELVAQMVWRLNEGDGV